MMHETAFPIPAIERPSLDQLRAQHKAELRTIFLHEKATVLDAVPVTEYDLILSCASKRYDAETLAVIVDELRKRKSEYGLREQPLTVAQGIALKASVQQILRRPNFSHTYNSVVTAIVRGLGKINPTQIEIKDLSRDESPTSFPPSKSGLDSTQY